MPISSNQRNLIMILPAKVLRRQGLSMGIVIAERRAAPIANKITK